MKDKEAGEGTGEGRDSEKGKEVGEGRHERNCWLLSKSFDNYITRCLVSSKIVVKRTAKQIKVALVIAIECQNLGVRICDERMNNKEKQPRGTQQDNSQRKTTMRGQRENEVRASNLRSNFSSTLPATDVEEQPSQAENVAQIKQQKKKQGPTRMAVIPLGKKSWLEVSFNLGGQLCGPNSESFASFLGVLTRAHVPIVMSSWKDLKEKNKDELWSLIQHEARAIALVKPDNVKSKEDWDKFVKERLGVEFQKLSEKFRAMRKQQKYTHTMSRKGYASMEYDMKLNHPNPEEINRVTLWTKAHERKDGTPINKVVSNILKDIKMCNESKENPPLRNSIRDDAIARVIGPESRGRVRGLGFGATPSRVDAIIQGSGRVKELESVVKSQSQRMQLIEAKLEAFIKMSQEPHNKNVEDMISAHACTQLQQGSRHVQDKSYNVNSRCGQSSNLEYGRCQLLHWYNFELDQVVAEGQIASTNPSVKVHHMPFGRDCWKVWVDEVLDEQLNLYRPTNEARRLGEALGSTVAWPKSCIKLFN
ncbi:hypothetical protein ACE6H2_022820 [Prunus campanulata]